MQDQLLAKQNNDPDLVVDDTVSRTIPQVRINGQINF